MGEFSVCGAAVTYVDCAFLQMYLLCNSELFSSRNCLIHYIIQVDEAQKR